MLLFLVLQCPGKKSIGHSIQVDLSVSFRVNNFRRYVDFFGYFCQNDRWYQEKQYKEHCCGCMLVHYGMYLETNLGTSEDHQQQFSHYHGCDRWGLHWLCQERDRNHLHWVPTVFSHKTHHQLACFLGNHHFSRTSLCCCLFVGRIERRYKERCRMGDHAGYHRINYGQWYGLLCFGGISQFSVYFLLFWQEIQGPRIPMSQHATRNQLGFGKCRCCQLILWKNSTMIGFMLSFLSLISFFC